jgi:hypothetical protein
VSDGSEVLFDALGCNIPGVRVFLAYPNEAAGEAETLNAALVQAGHRVFFAPTSIEGGDNYDQKISTELRRSDLFLGLLQRDAIVRRSYLLSEIELAAKEWPRSKGRIFPILVPGTALADVPKDLRYQAVEVAGDLTAEVVALVDRAGRRRLRRQLVIASGVSLLVAGAGAAAVVSKPPARYGTVTGPEARAKAVAWVKTAVSEAGFKAAEVVDDWPADFIDIHDLPREKVVEFLGHKQNEHARGQFLIAIWTPSGARRSSWRVSSKVGGKGTLPSVNSDVEMIDAPGLEPTISTFRANNAQASVTTWALIAARYLKSLPPAVGSWLCSLYQPRSLRLRESMPTGFGATRVSIVATDGCPELTVLSTAGTDLDAHQRLRATFGLSLLERGSDIARDDTVGIVVSRADDKVPQDARVMLVWATEAAPTNVPVQARAETEQAHDCHESPDVLVDQWRVRPLEGYPRPPGGQRVYSKGLRLDIRLSPRTPPPAPLPLNGLRLVVDSFEPARKSQPVDPGLIAMQGAAPPHEFFAWLDRKTVVSATWRHGKQALKMVSKEGDLFDTQPKRAWELATEPAPETLQLSGTVQVRRAGRYVFRFELWYGKDGHCLTPKLEVRDEAR